jgi:transposase
MEAEGIKKKRFDRGFKISAVKMITDEGGHKVSEVFRS